MPSDPIRITVPFDPHRLSSNQRLHWGERARRTQAVRTAARWAWRQAGEPQMDGPVRVSMLVRRGRPIDADNAVSGSKAARDALFVKGITPDDSPQWVTLGEVSFETGAWWRDRPEVVFTVECAGAAREGETK